MGTKKTSTTTNQYDTQSMNNYHSWQNFMMGGGAFNNPLFNAATKGGQGAAQAGGGFGGLMGLVANPFSSPFFNLNLQQQTKGASALAGRNMQNALLNFGRTGFGTGATGGMRTQLLSGLNRMGSGMQYGGFMNAVNQAQSDRWNAASLGSSLFSNPLQTGQQNVQKTSGLGTWLPQVVGGALAIGAAPFTGGASLAGLGSLMGKGAGMDSGYTPSGAFGGGSPTGYGGFNNYLSNNPGFGVWQPNLGTMPQGASSFPMGFGTPGIVPSPGS